MFAYVRLDTGSSRNDELPFITSVIRDIPAELREVISAKPGWLIWWIRMGDLVATF